MISPAIIPALEKVAPSVTWAITSESKFITANGTILDLSGFRGEELAMFKNLDDDRKATLLEAIVFKAGLTVDVAGNENDTAQAIVLDEPVVPENLVEDEVEVPQDEDEAVPQEEIVEEEGVAEEATVDAEEPKAEEASVPAKKTSKKKS